MTEVLVIMPYGHRSYLSRGAEVSIDFDKIYMDVIIRAIVKAGHTPLRIDELNEPGDVTGQYINKIFSAKIVIVDVSMPNGNVYYELGIRQSLSNHPTILVAQVGSELPFDIQSQRVLFYDNSAVEKTLQFIALLSEVLQDVGTKEYVNPIHTYLIRYGLSSDPRNTVAFEQDLRGKVDRASNAEQLLAVWNWAKAFKPLPPHTLLDFSEKCSKYSQWELAADIARTASVWKSDDYEILRKLGWYLRNAGKNHFGEAEAAFRKALRLNPGDTEAIGMLGGLLKRLGKYSEAAETYSKGVQIAPNNLYLRVAQAGMTLLSDPKNPLDALALYTSLRNLCLRTDLPDEWTLAVLGEAEFVLGNINEAMGRFLKVREIATSATVLTSPAEQIRLFAENGFRPDDGLMFASRLEDLAASVTTNKISASPRVDSIDPKTTKLAAVLHLSDVHFGSQILSDGKRRPMHRFECGDYSLPLIDHIVNEFRKKKSRFRFEAEQLYTVISGDFVYTGVPAEYQMALEFAKSLSNALEVPKDRMIFCPGNHDVNWQDSKIDRARRFDNYLSFLLEFYGEDLFRSLYPLITWDFKVNSARPDPTDLVSVVKSNSHSLLFASLNSCVYETEQHHYGFISGKQLRKLEGLLDAQGESALIKIAIVHHHIHPYPEPVQLDVSGAHWSDASTLRDGGLFEKFLEKYGFDIVLHGHKHKPQLRETLVRDRTCAEPLSRLIICGAGSCGVASAELEHSVPNQYEVLEFLSAKRIPRVDFVRIEWREIAVAPEAEWTTSNVWTVTG